MRFSVATAVLVLITLPAIPGSSVERRVPAPEELRKGMESFRKVCGTCHPLEIPLDARVKPGGWETILAAMSSRGAGGGAAGLEGIGAYLDSRSLFEVKCAACHDRDRCLSRRKSRDEWLLTVKQMSLRAEGGIGSVEAATIAAYLSVVCPDEDSS